MPVFWISNGREKCEYEIFYFAQLQQFHQLTSNEQTNNLWSGVQWNYHSFHWWKQTWKFDKRHCTKNMLACSLKCNKFRFNGDHDLNLSHSLTVQISKYLFSALQTLNLISFRQPRPNTKVDVQVLESKIWKNQSIWEHSWIIHMFNCSVEKKSDFPPPFDQKFNLQPHESSFSKQCYLTDAKWKTCKTRENEDDTPKATIEKGIKLIFTKPCIECMFKT